MDIQKGATEIYTCIEKALEKKEGALIGRNGTIELETLLFRTFGSSPNQQYPPALARKLELHAGIWPSDKKSIDNWIFQMLEAIRFTDVLVAGWYEPLKAAEERLLQKTNMIAPRIPLRSLEPYYVPSEERWTNLLAGQRVAVISSFTKTIKEQLEKKDLIWPVCPESLLPTNVEWVFVQTGYAPVLAQGIAEWPSDVNSWDVAVSSIVKQVVASQASIALIGCGGMGMVIGCELKKRGIIAIVLGGATQVLFGIKGMRWLNHPVISTFWNDAWVFPNASETPRGAFQIEGACYWK
jgi:hypothetical protein